MTPITITANHELAEAANVTLGTIVTIEFIENLWYIVRSIGHKECTEKIQRAIVKNPELIEKIKESNTLEWTLRYLQYYSKE